MKYLIPITNSKLSKETLRKTIETAEEDAKLIILHCVSDQLNRKQNMFVNNQDKKESIAKNTIKNAKKLCSEYDIEYTTEVLYSESVERGIREAEQKYNPDKVIMSHRNTRPPEKSITKNVLREIETPITIFTEQMI